MAANNNNAVNFVNHSASINSDATINAPPVHVMIAPGSVNNTSTVIIVDFISTDLNQEQINYIS